MRILAALLMLAFFGIAVQADEPYARSKDYDLQHSKVVLKFDLDQKQIIGDVTHTVSILKAGTENSPLIPWACKFKA